MFPHPDNTAFAADQSSASAPRTPYETSGVRTHNVQLARRVSALAGAAAAANRSAVKAHVAATAFLHAAGHRVAAALQNAAAGFVAGQAGDAAAVGCVFTPRHAAGQVALTYGDAAQRTAARANAPSQLLAQVLQRGTGHIVFTAAMDFETARALFELDFAARNNAPVGSGSGGRASKRSCGSTQCTTIHHNGTRHQRNSSWLADASGGSSRQISEASNIASPAWGRMRNSRRQFTSDRCCNGF